MLIMDEPIFWVLVLFATAPNIEKFSIPHVSGIQIESIFVLDIIFVHSITCSTESNEPKLHAIRMKLVWIMDILVYLF